MSAITRLTWSFVITLVVNTAMGGGLECAAGSADPAARTPATAGAVIGEEAARLDEQLDRLVEQLDQRRRELHIPGLAIAVVKDDEVILARGLGVADVATNKPVTPETLFAIGSATKPFTSTLIGMLVDEGTLAWDDAVTDYLPFFDLRVAGAAADAVLTFRDLLAHRTGFARMSVLFVGGAVSRHDVLRAAARAEPLVEFRRSFLYNNVMYLAAGVAAGNAAGSDWDSLVAERLLEPLGMSRSSIGIPNFGGDDELAGAYDWDEARAVFAAREPRDNRLIAPAGAIVSNVEDMARWVRFQLGRGRLEGKRLISEQQLGETWTPQIAVGGRGAYGLGWMLSEWNGQPVVAHGGNTRGYAAQVALLPESGVGFVLLANVTATPLQQLAMPMVWEAVLGSGAAPENAENTTSDPGVELLGDYVGAYLPTHRRAEFSVSERGGRLALTIPPNMRPFELRPPDQNGKRFFVATDQMAVSFERDDSGAVVVMRLYQGPQEYECVRAGVELPAEIDLGELDRYLGTYRSAASGRTVTAIIQNNRLAIDAPGTAIFELHPPDSEGKWVTRLDAGVAVSFGETPDGHVVSLFFQQPGAPDVEMTRIEGAEAVPTTARLLELRRGPERKEALDRLGVFRLSGKVSLPHAGIDGSVDWHVAGSDRMRRESDYGDFGVERLTLNGESAWQEAAGSPLTELHGKFLEQARRAHPAAIFGDWSDIYPSVRLLRAAMLDDRETWVVKLGGGDVPDATAWVDAETGDLVRLDGAVIDASSTLAIPMRVLYDDYRDVEGVRVPFRIVTSTEITGDVVIELESIEARLELDEALFSRR